MDVAEREKKVRLTEANEGGRWQKEKKQNKIPKNKDTWLKKNRIKREITKQRKIYIISSREKGRPTTKKKEKKIESEGKEWQIT